MKVGSIWGDAREDIAVPHATQALAHIQDANICTCFPGNFKSLGWNMKNEIEWQEILAKKHSAAACLRQHDASQAMLAHLQLSPRMGGCHLALAQNISTE